MAEAAAVQEAVDAAPPETTQQRSDAALHSALDTLGAWADAAAVRRLATRELLNGAVPEEVSRALRSTGTQARRALDAALDYEVNGTRRADAEAADSCWHVRAQQSALQAVTAMHTAAKRRAREEARTKREAEAARAAAAAAPAEAAEAAAAAAAAPPALAAPAAVSYANGVVFATNDCLRFGTVGGGPGPGLERFQRLKRALACQAAVLATAAVTRCTVNGDAEAATQADLSPVVARLKRDAACVVAEQAALSPRTEGSLDVLTRGSLKHVASVRGYLVSLDGAADAAASLSACPALSLEHADGGLLATRLVTTKRLSERDTLRWARGCAAGIAACAAAGVAYGGATTHTVRLFSVGVTDDGDVAYDAKLCDFSSARFLPGALQGARGEHALERPPARRPCLASAFRPPETQAALAAKTLGADDGTVWPLGWAPPEARSAQGGGADDTERHATTAESDVYGLGCLLWEMAMRTPLDGSRLPPNAPPDFVRPPALRDAAVDDVVAEVPNRFGSIVKRFLRVTLEPTVAARWQAEHCYYALDQAAAAARHANAPLPRVVSDALGLPPPPEPDSDNESERSDGTAARDAARLARRDEYAAQVDRKGKRKKEGREAAKAAEAARAAMAAKLDAELAADEVKRRIEDGWRRTVARVRQWHRRRWLHNLAPERRADLRRRRSARSDAATRKARARMERDASTFRAWPAVGLLAWTEAVAASTCAAGCLPEPRRDADDADDAAASASSSSAIFALKKKQMLAKTSRTAAQHGQHHELSAADEAAVEALAALDELPDPQHSFAWWRRGHKADPNLLAVRKDPRGAASGAAVLAHWRGAFAKAMASAGITPSEMLAAVSTAEEAAEKGMVELRRVNVPFLLSPAEMHDARRTSLTLAALRDQPALVKFFDGVAEAVFVELEQTAESAALAHAARDAAEVAEEAERRKAGAAAGLYHATCELLALAHRGRGDAAAHIQKYARGGRARRLIAEVWARADELAGDEIARRQEEARLRALPRGAAYKAKRSPRPAASAARHPVDVDRVTQGSATLRLCPTLSRGMAQNELDVTPLVDEAGGEVRLLMTFALRGAHDNAADDADSGGADRAGAVQVLGLEPHTTYTASVRVTPACQGRLKRAFPYLTIGPDGTVAEIGEATFATSPGPPAPPDPPVASVVALRGARELPALLRGTRKQAQDGMVGDVADASVVVAVQWRAPAGRGAMPRAYRVQRAFAPPGCRVDAKSSGLEWTTVREMAARIGTACTDLPLARPDKALALEDPEAYAAANAAADEREDLLSEGYSLQYRVQAANAVGWGRPGRAAAARLPIEERPKPTEAAAEVVPARKAAPPRKPIATAGGLGGAMFGGAALGDSLAVQQARILKRKEAAAAAAAAAGAGAGATDLARRI